MKVVKLFICILTHPLFRWRSFWGFVLNHSASIQYLSSFTLTDDLVCQHTRAICHLKSEGGTSVSSSSVISNDGFESISLACYAAVFPVTNCRRAAPQHAMFVDDTNGDERQHGGWRASVQRQGAGRGVPVTLIPVAEGDRRLVREMFTVTARDTGVLPRLSGTCPCSFCRTDTQGGKLTAAGKCSVICRLLFSHVPT